MAELNTFKLSPLHVASKVCMMVVLLVDGVAPGDGARDDCADIVLV